jgi:small subunit ribosomal protein S20
VANSAQAKKRVRQTEQRRVCNVSMSSKMRTQLKHFRAAIVEKDKENAESIGKVLVKFFGRMISKKLIHKNKAARLTSKMNAKIKSLS